MDVDPGFYRKPLRERLDMLVKAWTIGGSPPPEAPWLSQGVAQALLQRFAIEETSSLTKETSRLTKWLIALTAVLVVLGAAGLFTGWWFWAHPR